MAQISAPSYVYARSKVWSTRRKKNKRQNRFDVYEVDPAITIPSQNGLLSSPTDWYMATPNLKRDENILLVGSSTWGSSVSLKIKWRPNEQLNLYTMLTSFTIECGKDKPTYDYDEVWTQSVRPPDDQQQRAGSYIEKYCGQNISLEVLIPYSKYRLFFSGYMRDRQNDNKLLYVRFRALVSGLGKIFDFKEQYDSEFVARQLAKTRQQTKDIDCIDALNQLFLQDRHEHNVQFRCVYTLGKDDSTTSEHAEEQKLFCWGFHARHFIQPSDASTRFTRVLGYFSSGTWFHLGSVERAPLESNLDSKQDSKQDNRIQMDFGYACPQNQVSYPIQRLDPVDWDQISASGGKQFQFKFKCNNIPIEVQSSPDSNNVNGDFIDVVSNEKRKGRALILTDEIVKQDQIVVDKSVSDYVSSVHTKPCRVIDLTYLETQWATTKLLDSYRPLVVGLGQPDAQYSSLCGAKAASLAQLLRYRSDVRPDSEFEVPNGVVLTRYAWDLILELNANVQQAQQRLAQAVNQDNKEDVRQLSEQIRGMFSRASGNNDQENAQKVNVPDQLVTELKQAMLTTYGIGDLAKSDKPFAVRSSSWGEDDQDMSAAGQLTTLLSIRGLDQLCDAILICFASKYSLTNLEYKHQRGLPIDMPMGIVIQEMIECDKAGVLFTCDPINGDHRRMVITANYGLGESVVSAAADPDTVVVGVVVDPQEPNDFSKRRLDSWREVKIGKKTVIMTGDSIESKQSQEYGLSKNDTAAAAESQQQLPQHDGLDLSKCCLSQDEITKLADCALKLVGYFRCARDIEWGLKDGQLYLFQSRPLTGLDAMNEFEVAHEFSDGVAAEKEWLSRANVGEVMPMPIRPLTLTYLFRFWNIAMECHLRRLGMMKRENWFPNRPGEMVYNGYYGFFNLRQSRLFRFAGGEKRPIIARAAEIAFFGHEVEEPELAEACAKVARPVSGYAQLRNTMDSWPLKYAPDKKIARDKNKVKGMQEDILERKFAESSSLADLFRQMNVILPRLVNGVVDHIGATMLSSEYNYQPLQLLAKFIDDPTKLFACWSRLLSTVNSDVFSARVPRLINEMSEVLAARGLDQLKTFVALSDADSLNYINDDKPEDGLKKMFDKFLREYGHRAYNEFDLGTQRWGEDPTIVIKMIKQSCQKQLRAMEDDAPKVAAARNEETPGGQLLEDVMKSKFSFVDRLRMNRFILPNCHKFVGVRERTKDLIVYQANCLRCAASVLANEMRNQGRLPDADLIFYLTLGEVERLTERPQPAIVMHAQRRRRYIQKVEGWKFDEVLTGYDFQPRHMSAGSDEAIKLANDLKNLPKIIGTPASSGIAEGRVCVVNEYKQLDKVKPGDILVTYATDISFSPVFPLLAGIITEIGGMISHGAVIAREYGLPTLIGVSGACSIFEDGERVMIDANQGHVLRLDLAADN